MSTHGGLSTHDQVIRENPASRGTETYIGRGSCPSALGCRGRDGVERRSTAAVPRLINAHSGRRPRRSREGPPRPVINQSRRTRSHPPPPWNHIDTTGKKRLTELDDSFAGRFRGEARFPARRVLKLTYLPVVYLCGSTVYASTDACSYQRNRDSHLRFPPYAK